MDKVVKKVLFAVPTEGNTEPEAYDNRLTMLNHMGMLEVLSGLGLKKYKGVDFVYPEGVQYEFSIGSVGRVLTPLAREKLAEMAVEGGFDYMFSVDDDMICPTTLFEQLVRHDVDIVAALAFSRYPPHKPVIYKVNSGYDPAAKMDYFINNVVYDYPKDSLVECDAVGFGAVLIKVDVIRQMKKDWFMSTTGAGEDIYFCWKAAKEAGAKIFMDTSVKLGHLGARHNVTEETFLTKENQEMLKHSI